MDITDYSRKLAKHFGESLGYTEEKIDLLRFGFETLIGEGIKLIALLVIALTYHLLAVMLAAVTTFILFRFTSGGAHSDSHKGCFIMTTLTFTAVAFAGRIAGTALNVESLMTLVAGVFILSLLGITLWAPAENKNKPINPRKKKHLKYLSYLLLGIWIFSTLIIKKITLPSIYLEIISASAFALVFQVFTLSPLGFRFMEYTDKIINGKEGMEDVKQA